MSRGCFFDEAAAEHAARFFPKFLSHSKGKMAGKAFDLLDWQRNDVIMPIFGWMRPPDEFGPASRRFRKTFIEIPKKNGKSTLAAGVGLYLLIGDGEQGAEVYSAATDQAQASIVHGEAVNMVQASRALSSMLKINLSSKVISYPQTNSSYKSLSREAASKEGLNAHGIIVDELHAWNGRRLWEALMYATRARQQGLIFVITTAGDDEQTICYEQYLYAKDVLAGRTIDDRFFAYIREADKDDDWTEAATWRKANPSWGDTINTADFAADVEEAKKTPTAQASFKRYSLNVWSVGSTPWLAPESWAACGEPYTADSLIGRDCYGGLDLSRTKDMTALTLIFPDGYDRYLCLPYFWLPEEIVHSTDSPAEYRAWAAAGYLRTTPGNVCDYAFIKRDIIELGKKYRIGEFAFDPWNAEQVTQEIADTTGIKRAEFRQTLPNFAGPTAEFERLVLGRGLRHNNHPILNLQAIYCAVRMDASGNKRPVKPPTGHRKIDGICAAIMGLSVALKPEYKFASGSLLAF